MLKLHDLLSFTVENGGSDLHLKAGSPPHVRVDGRLMASSYDPVTAADTERMVADILPLTRAEEFAVTSEADFAYSVAGVGRFRVNAFRQRGSVGLVFRRVLPGIPTFETLGLPGVVPRLADEPRGLVLVTGPTGSGRTTTLASMVDHINSSRAVNIVTIEDPIEILHSDKMAIVNQRELGTDTRDVAEALRRALRQDPDVIVVGECTDQTTAEAMLAAAETGVLVLAAMRTATATQTVERVVEFFPPAQQRQVNHTLAKNLRGIVSLKLLERADGHGRIPAVETMVMTARIFERIEAGASNETLEETIAEGEYHGMQTFDQSLFALYKNGLVTLSEAMAASSHQVEFRIALEAAGLLSLG